jgi:hypothetical protein
LNDTRYPQPYEGISGTVCGDGLLDLDDKAIAFRRRMITVAGALRDAVTVGNPAPKVAKLDARMRDPEVGDLVMEAGTPYSRDPDRQIRGFGILLAHRDEWMTTDQEWAAEASEDDERFHDHAWYVQYGPAAEDVCRWTDCEFIAVPTGLGGGIWNQP